VIVKDGKVIATGVNQIKLTNDPTAHAELSALREAGKALVQILKTVLFTRVGNLVQCV
jgi:tRNA(Arg) A34 adenosine deaminase TadA